MSALRILYVTRQLPPEGVGGIGTYVDQLAELMAAEGHDVTVLCAAPGQPRTREQRGRVRIERFGALGPRWLWAMLHRRSWPAASRLHGALSAWAALRRLDGTFDVIEAPEWKAEGLLLGRPRKGPVLVHLHLPQELVRRWSGTPLRRARGAALAEWLERRTVLAASAVTATSQLSRTLPDGTPWLPDVSIDVVPPPMEVDEWSTCPPVAATAPVVLFLGHLEHRKAPEVVLEALAQLRSEVAGLRAVFVGRTFDDPDGRPYDERLRSEADRLGLECDVLPPRSGRAAMIELYARARAVVVPSRYETLSMVALEGFACGRPVVVTDAVGAAEWTAAAAPELVVPVDDATALAAALRPLLLDAAEAHRLGRAGRDAVARACSRHEVVSRREAVYRRAAGRQAVPC